MVPRRVKLLVSGYVHETELHHKEHVPIDIVTVIITYYYLFGQFDLCYHGKALRFANLQTAQVIDDGKWATCIYGSFLNKTICNKLELHLQFSAAARSTRAYFGCITKEPVTECIKSFNHQMFHKLNRSHSQGIHVYITANSSTDKDISTIYVYQPHRDLQGVTHFGSATLITRYQTDTALILLFDFVHNKHTVSYGTKQTDIKQMNFNESMLPVFTLRDKGTELHITKCIVN